MALKTSVYLPDHVEAAWLAAKARGDTLAAVVARGLGVPDPAAEAVSEAASQISAEIEHAVERGFARALSDLQQGSSF